MRARFMELIHLLFIASHPIGAASALATQVMVDGAQQFQTIEGFGACLVAWVDRFRRLYRTSTCENLQNTGQVAVNDNKAPFEMTPQNIVTFSGKIDQ